MILSEALFSWVCLFVVLEHFQKYYNHSEELIEKAVFLGFGFVSAQSQGFSNLPLRQSLAKAQKSSLRIGYNIFSNAQLEPEEMLCRAIFSRVIPSGDEKSFSRRESFEHRQF